jgi:hypothetical protein
MACSFRPLWDLYGDHPAFEARGGGSILWRGIDVEHFSHDDESALLESARRLIEKCEHLESIGVPVNGSTAVWCSDWFDGMKADDPLKPFLSLTPGIYQEGMTEADHLAQREACCPGVGHRDWTPEDAPTGRILWTLKSGVYVWDARQPVGQRLSRLEIPGFEIAKDGMYHALFRRGFYSAKMGQPIHCGVCYADFEQVRAFLHAHGFDGSEPFGD